MSNSFYWSCMEFWVELARHRPYFGVVDLLPCLISIALTLSSFWLDEAWAVQAVLAANLVLNVVTGWDLLLTLPPGNGTIPRFGQAVPSLFESLLAEACWPC